MEVVQYFLPYRSFSFGDMAANAAGAFLAGVCICMEKGETGLDAYGRWEALIQMAFLLYGMADYFLRCLPVIYPGCAITPAGVFSDCYGFMD